MKRIITILLIAAIMLGISACSGKIEISGRYDVYSDGEYIDVYYEFKDGKCEQFVDGSFNSSGTYSIDGTKIKIEFEEKLPEEGEILENGKTLKVGYGIESGSGFEFKKVEQ